MGPGEFVRIVDAIDHHLHELHLCDAAIGFMATDPDSWGGYSESVRLVLIEGIGDLRECFDKLLELVKERKDDGSEDSQ